MSHHAFARSQPHHTYIRIQRKTTIITSLKSRSTRVCCVIVILLYPHGKYDSLKNKYNIMTSLRVSFSTLLYEKISTRGPREFSQQWLLMARFNKKNNL